MLVYPEFCWLLCSVLSKVTVEEARSLWQLPNVHSIKGKRARAILAVLLGCGLRRRELVDLNFDHIQRREDHCGLLIS